MSYFLSRSVSRLTNPKNLSFKSSSIEAFYNTLTTTSTPRTNKTSNDGKPVVDKLSFYAIKKDINLSTVRRVYEHSAKFDIDTDFIFLEDASSIKVPSSGLVFTDFNSPESEAPSFYHKFSHTCLGGTFDDLHLGHKLLLTEAIFTTSSKITVGIANDNLLIDKKLKHFLNSSAIRQEKLQQFLTKVDFDKNLSFDIQEIQDPVGPAGTLDDLDAIIVSEETESGGDYVNEIRQGKNLSKLKVHVCPLLLAYKLPKTFSGSGRQLKKLKMGDAKISSSINRMNKLGEIVKQPAKRDIKDLAKPYIIGLTGGSCSGKSSIAKKLEKLSSEDSRSLKATIIDCDKLGHEAYNIGTDCYKKLVAHFGQEIVVSENKGPSKAGQINRAALGAIVFKEKSQLKNLTDIVWPEISKMVQEKINKMDPNKQVAVVDAAILIEAGWRDFCNEVWVCTLDRPEQIKRIVNRDLKTEAQAEARLDSQMSDEKRCKAAHVLLSTKWEEEYTLEQCLKAWQLLEGRLA